MGTCRWLTCTSSLGTEYRLLDKSSVMKTFMCHEHEVLLDGLFAKRRAGEPTPAIRVTPEGTVYADLWDAIIKRAAP